MKRTDIRRQDVFISWTGKDIALKNKIKDFLSGENLTVLESDESCSGDFRQWSREAVGACSIFLPVITKNSIKSTYMPFEIEEYKKLPDYCNRIVPVVTDYEIYSTHYSDIAQYGNAVLLNGDELTNEHLEAIAFRVKSLIINLLDKVYKENTRPDYIKLVPFIKTRNFSDSEFDFKKLLIPRTLKETDEGGNIIKENLSEEELLSSKDICFLSGPAGCGKTTYTDRLRHSEKSEDIIISVPCRMVTSDDSDLFSAMFNVFSKACGNRYFYTEEDFVCLLKARNLILILDGMDEIPTESETRKFLTKTSEYIKNSAENTTVIYTSRNQSDGSLITINGKKPRRFILEGLGKNQIQNLSENLFLLFGSSEKNTDFYLKIKDLEEEITSNPLLLSQLAIVYEDSGNIPETVVGIYDAVSEIIFKLDKNKEFSKIPENFKDTVANLKSLLTRFARLRYTLLSRGKNVPTVKVFEKILSETHPDDYENRAEFISEYLKNRAIVSEDGFYHKMLLEYFTAVSFFNQVFDAFGDMENPEVQDELFLNYENPYWEQVIKLYLLKADCEADEDTVKQLFERIISKKIQNHHLLFHSANDFIKHRKTALLEVLKDVVEKSAKKEIHPYGTLFYCVPEYSLEEILKEILFTVCEEDYFPNAAALARDVFFLSDIYRFEGNGEELFKKAASGLFGVRYALCELFYTGKTDSDAGRNVYPRLFNTAEAESFMQRGCGIFGSMTEEFSDELSLYSHNSINEINGEGTGFVSLPCNEESEKLLLAKNGSKITAIAFGPTDSDTFGYFPFIRSSVKNIFIPENVYSASADAFLHMPLTKKTIALKKKSITFKDHIYIENAKEIPENFFKYTEEITSVRIGKGVEKIGDRAFSFCKNLKSVIIDEGVTEIGKNAFAGCDSLTDITIPSTTEKIGPACFWGCKNLKDIVLPEKAVEIPRELFMGCSALSSVRLGKNIKSIGETAFSHCDSLEEVNLYESLESIGKSAFFFCKKLKEINISGFLKEIPEKAFMGCMRMKKITLPDSLTRIDAMAFNGCVSLLELKLPESLEYIGESAFSECSNITDIDFPETLKTIERKAFYNCDNIKHAKIPERITWLGDDIFKRCDLLESAVIPDCFDTEDRLLSTWLGIPGECEISYFPTPEDFEVPKFDLDMTSVIDLEDVKEIPENAYFQRIYLTKINLPEGLEKIGKSAFSCCTSLSEIVIPETVTEIGEGAFTYCLNLEKAVMENSQIKILNPMVFSGCTALKEIKLPETVTEIGHHAFFQCAFLEKAELSKKLERIDSSAFEHAFRLKEINLPDTLTYIGSMAFSGCSELESLNLTDNITCIGGMAFHNCKNIKTIHIPKNLKKISVCLFDGCENLSLEELPEGITEIGGRAFYGCRKITSLNIPGSVESIGELAFADTSLKTIELHPSIKKIGAGAFAGCDELNSVKLSINFKNEIENIFGRIPEKIEFIRELI